MGFYEPTSTEINKAWEQGKFIFDANALLNLYRYSDSTREDFLLALSKLQDNLFMPYQVGLEYHTNRLNVIDNLCNTYTSLEDAIKEIFEKNLTNQLNQYKRHPSIDIENIIKLKDDFLVKLKDELASKFKQHPDFTSQDDILNQLTSYYEKKVGKQFSKEELQKIYNEGKDRYADNIPPGYRDAKNKKDRGDQNIYGDLIIWKEIIVYAKKEKKPVILITDDRKDDWWTIENGKTLRPREELIKEFYDLTGVRILIYNADNFLKFAKERKLLSQIKETSISEIKEVRKADESYRQWSDLIKSINLNISNKPSALDMIKDWEILSKPNAFDLIRNWNAEQSNKPNALDMIKDWEILSKPNAFDLIINGNAEQSNSLLEGPSHELHKSAIVKNKDVSTSPKQIIKRKRIKKQ